MLLWVASLTPAQASELSRNHVVSPLLYILADLNVIRSGVLTWIDHYGLIWKQQVRVALHRQTVLPRVARIESAMDLF